MSEKEFDKALKEIEDLRKQREKLFKEKVYPIDDELTEAIKSLGEDRENTMVTFESIKSAPMNTPVPINKDIYFIKYFQSNNVIKTKLYMAPNSSFGLQQHDCLEETRILKGHLIETMRRHKAYGVGQVISYMPYELHKPYTEMETILEVILTSFNFNKDEKS